MNSKNTISDFTLSDEEKKRLLNAIINFFDQERDEKIGIIASENLLEFFLDTLGKTIYNKALDDAKIWFENKMEFMESEFYTMYKNTD